MDLSKVSGAFNQQVRIFYHKLAQSFYETKVCSSDELKEFLIHKQFVDEEVSQDPFTKKVMEWYAELCDQQKDGSDQLLKEIFRIGKENRTPDLRHNPVFRAYGADAYYHKMHSEERDWWRKQVQSIHKAHSMSYKMMSPLENLLKNVKIDKTKKPDLPGIMQQLLNPTNFQNVASLLVDQSQREALADAASTLLANDKSDKVFDMKKFMPDDEEVSKEEMEDELGEAMAMFNKMDLNSMVVDMASGKKSLGDIVAAMPVPEGLTEEKQAEFKNHVQEFTQGAGFEQLTSLMGGDQGPIDQSKVTEMMQKMQSRMTQNLLKVEEEKNEPEEDPDQVD